MSDVNPQTGLTEQEAAQLVSQHLDKVRTHLDSKYGEDVRNAAYNEIQRKGGLSDEQIWNLVTTQKPEAVAEAMVQQHVRESRSTSDDVEAAWHKMRAKEKGQSVGRPWSPPKDKKWWDR
jgi:hypothetical protein